METTIMENQMEKKLENQMETGIIMGYICFSFELSSVGQDRSSRQHCSLCTAWGQLQPARLMSKHPSSVSLTVVLLSPPFVTAS